MMNDLYDNIYFDTAEADNDIQQADDGLVLIINEETIQKNVNEYLISLIGNKQAKKTPLIIDVQLESVNLRKAKHILGILYSLLEHYDTENLLVLWYYEATDEKAYELGLRLQIQTRINISFQVY
jgi:hypothetical protein